QALKQVVDEHGVNSMVAICAICKAQFSKALPAYQFPMDMITSLHQVVGDAIQLGTKT
ncbi:MAG: (Fe-S)-binding protein, partial [Gammaproteobacteria bacterium]|nr:(Fe-S)-binding protein [Gammaproteobacteria bacterium]